MTYALTILVLTLSAIVAAAGGEPITPAAQPGDAAAAQPAAQPAQAASDADADADSSSAAPAAGEGETEAKTGVETDANAEATSAALPDDVTPEVADLLTRIEAATQKVDTLTGKIVYDRIQGLLGDRQRRFGQLVFVAGPPAQFAIHLDRLLVDDVVRPQDRWYIFDGRWLVERLDDERRFTKWQIIPPDRDPAKVDPLGTGEGPFALPIRVNRDNLLRRFKVSLVESAEGDPADTIHLKLLPREDVRVEFEELDLYYHRETLLPVQVRTLDDADSGDESIITLRDVTLNGQNVDTKLINVDPPKDRGWRIEIKPWEDAPRSAVE